MDISSLREIDYTAAGGRHVFDALLDSIGIVGSAIPFSTMIPNIHPIVLREGIIRINVANNSHYRLL
jgi:hypothetical protein